MVITNLMDFCLHAFVLSLTALTLYLQTDGLCFIRGSYLVTKLQISGLCKVRGVIIFPMVTISKASFIWNWWSALMAWLTNIYEITLSKLYIAPIPCNALLLLALPGPCSAVLFHQRIFFWILLFGIFRADIQCYHFAKSLQNAGFARFTSWCSYNSNSKQPYNFVWVVQCLNWPCQT